MDAEKVKREEKAYKKIPVITDFTDEKGNDRMKETVQENYRRIKEEVKQIVQEELERIAQRRKSETSVTAEITELTGYNENGRSKVSNLFRPLFSSGILCLSSHALHLFITEHLLVQFFLHPVNEIGAAFVLPAFDVDVETVTVL